MTRKALGLENIGNPMALMAQIDTSRSIHLWSKSMLEVGKQKTQDMPNVELIHGNAMEWCHLVVHINVVFMHNMELGQ